MMFKFIKTIWQQSLIPSCVLHCEMRIVKIEVANHAYISKNKISKLPGVYKCRSNVNNKCKTIKY